MQQANTVIKDTFLELAEYLEGKRAASSAKVLITGLGSELGEENVLKGAALAAKNGVQVVYLGTMTHPGLSCIQVANEEEAHQKMEELLSAKAVDAAVTMHYPFPIGVSTIGRVITPAEGKEMFIASTTGTSSTNRVEAMVINALYGIACAQALGMESPSLGILNIEGARQAEGILQKLKAGGFPLCFASSKRKDGGAFMRGNDVINPPCDIMLCDSLTGNVLMKMLSAFTSGGAIETLGCGYGPGLKEKQDKLVLIVSRASGYKVIEGALGYAAKLAQGDVNAKVSALFQSAKKAGLDSLLSALKEKPGKAEDKEEVKAPEKQVVDESIAGVEIMELEDAVRLLWKKGIYAESGMGCTGPVIMIPHEKLDAALSVLKEGKFI